MARDDKVVLRKQDGSGAGVILDRRDVKRFLATSPDYAEESADETTANQQAADAEVERQADEAAAKKAKG